MNRAKVIAIAAALMLTSCRTTKIIPVERVRTDTVYKVREHRDSIRLHDSITVTQYLSGDTVYHIRDRWHTKYVERLRTDTVYRSRVDSIPVPYPVEVKSKGSGLLRFITSTAAIAGIILMVGFRFRR